MVLSLSMIMDRSCITASMVLAQMGERLLIAVATLVVREAAFHIGTLGRSFICTMAIILSMETSRERREERGDIHKREREREKEIAPECSKCLGKRHLLEGTYSRCAALQTIGKAWFVV